MPDWNNYEQEKFYPMYKHREKKFIYYSSCSYQEIILLRYLKTQEECEKLIKEREKELTILKDYENI